MATDPHNLNRPVFTPDDPSVERYLPRQGVPRRGGMSATDVVPGVRAAANAATEFYDVLKKSTAGMQKAAPAPPPAPDAPEFPASPRPKSPATRTDAYGVPMFMSTQGGGLAFTDSAFDPIHYGVNAAGPASPKYAAWAAANPDAAKQFAADTAQLRTARDTRVKREEDEAFQKALQLGAPATALTLPLEERRVAVAETGSELAARELEERTAAREAQERRERDNATTASAAAQAAGRKKTAQDAYASFLALGTERFPDDPVAARNYALINTINSADMSGADLRGVNEINAAYTAMQQQLAQRVNNPSWSSLATWMPGTGYNAPWDGENSVASTNAYNEAVGLPRLDAYDIGGNVQADLLTNPITALPAFLSGSAVTALGSPDRALTMVGPDGQVQRRVAIDANEIDSDVLEALRRYEMLAGNSTAAVRNARTGGTNP